jgi:hypothetical protein
MFGIGDERVNSATDLTACDCGYAARASADTYRHHGHDADVQELEVTPDGRCLGHLVTVAELLHAEVVLDQASDFAAVRAHLAGLTSAGWSAWAVVPLPRLAEAHLRFSGAAEFVQGWWARDDKNQANVAFTAPEIP